MTEATLFSKPTRQSSIAIIFILGNIFKMLLRQLWVLILVFIFNPKKNVFNSFTFILLGMAAFGAVMSIISYYSYYFFIRNGELVMEKGVLRRIKVNVPLDRIQTINFKQSLLHQAFNVVSVEIDTAGSTGKEFSLQAIKKEQAEALRDFVENFKKSAVASPPVRQFGTGELETELADSETEDWGTAELPTAKLLFRLSPLDLLKIGIGQNHLRTAGIIMAFFLGFLDDLEEALDFNLSEETQKIIGLGQGGDFIFYLLLAIPFFLLVSFFLTLVNTTLRYFDLRFWRTERGFKMVSGLFTRQEVSANLPKIQFMRWTSSPLMRVFGMRSVRLPQAASVQAGRKMSVSVPGCYEPHLTAIRETYFPDEKNYSYEEHGVSRRIIRRQLIYQGLIPVALMMLLTRSLMGNAVWVWLLWLPIAWGLAVKYYHNWRWYVSEEGLLTSWGVVTRRSVLLQWYKVQAVTVRQSFFFRRLGLANLVLFTAAGAVSVPYIPLEKAKAVQDYVLYKVETDRREWM